jgi:hypothetical protein
VYEIDKPGPLTWKTVACPRPACKNVVRFPIPQNASFTLDAPAFAPEPGHDAHPEPPPPEVRPAVKAPLPEAAPRSATPPRANAPERSEALACASCGHRFTLRYKYQDADAETVMWVQCPNCGSSQQVWVLEGAHDIQV